VGDTRQRGGVPESEENGMKGAKMLKIMIISGDFEAALTCLENDHFEEALQNSKDATEKIQQLMDDAKHTPAKPPGAKQLTINV
jgi:hypothetical protein